MGHPAPKLSPKHTFAEYEEYRSKLVHVSKRNKQRLDAARKIDPFFIPNTTEFRKMNVVVIKLFFKNNAYLLRLGGSRPAVQLKELFNMGFSFKASTMRSLKYGCHDKISLTVFSAFSRYWSIPLWEMISCDFEERDNAEAQVLQDAEEKKRLKPK